MIRVSLIEKMREYKVFMCVAVTFMSVAILSVMLTIAVSNVKHVLEGPLVLKGASRVCVVRSRTNSDRDLRGFIFGFVFHKRFSHSVYCFHLDLKRQNFCFTGSDVRHQAEIGVMGRFELSICVSLITMHVNEGGLPKFQLLGLKLLFFPRILEELFALFKSY